MIIGDDQLKQLLIKANIANEKQLKEMSEYAATAGVTLSDALIEKDVLSDENLGILISDAVKIPFIVLSKTTVPPDVLRILPPRIIRKYKVVPFALDKNGVRLAMADPKNTELIEFIKKKTGLATSIYYSTERDIASTLRVFRKNLQRTFDVLISQEVTRAGVSKQNEAPIAKIVDLIIDYAYQDKASDIHIEPEEKDSLVRFRIDGILHDVLFLPKNIHDQIATRIKVLSRLRTDEHLSPQDGKLRISMAEEELDIRISILPVTEGEKIVMRLLASHFRQFSLIDLGMNEKDLQKVTKGYSKSYGMVLSTGPTGSGKTTSIYSILKLINTREKNITTIEDPVEYRIKGLNQIHVNTKAELTFANGLRSILRQDPNIIFVGEIRDAETAGIAVNAALTGHLVLSTLHTNDAATALPRLIDMSVEPYLVASTVNVIIAQRLVRKICELCKAAQSIPRTELLENFPQDIIKKHFKETPSVQVYKGAGCGICHNTGYSGRVGLFEVLEVTSTIKKLIAEKNDSTVLFKQAVAEGMTTMIDDGMEKIIIGLTTIEEVLRVTKVETL
ncbi:MAG TPA: GspE/PulE family protein [Patescibacteria group bacterium]|nr:GspE/PulE family protein [Patescibacteria group bacterium]